MAKAVCGECMQTEDKHLNYCSSNPRNSRSTPRSLGADRGPLREISSGLDNPKYQRKRQKDADRYNRIKAKKPNVNRDQRRKIANKAIGKKADEITLERGSRNTFTASNAPEGTMVVKGFFGGYKIVKDPNSDLWKD